MAAIMNKTFQRQKIDGRAEGEGKEAANKVKSPWIKDGRNGEGHDGNNSQGNKGTYCDELFVIWQEIKEKGLMQMFQDVAQTSKCQLDQSKYQ